MKSFAYPLAILIVAATGMASTASADAAKDLHQIKARVDANMAEKQQLRAVNVPPTYKGGSAARRTSRAERAKDAHHLLRRHRDITATTERVQPEALTELLNEIRPDVDDRGGAWRQGRGLYTGDAICCSGLPETWG